jgi:PEP-CTERM motif-containing protein
MKTKFLGSVSLFSLPFLLTPAAFATGITPGDLVVVQVGATGSVTALAGTATATFLDEYTPTGTLVQQIALPTSASGSSDALTLSGTSTAEGFLSISSDGNYLTLGGYNQTVGGTTAANAASAVNRVVGLVNISTGSADTTTALSSGTSGNIRSVATANGSSFYVASSSAGVGYVGTFGSVTSALQLSTTPVNTRVVNISGGQLYVSSSSGTFLGLSTIGSGLPTTAGQTTTGLAGFPTSGTHSSYDYWFANSSTVYVADDGSAAAGGGIQKWTLSGGTWSLQYTLLNNGTSTTDVRGLTGEIVGGNTELFGTTSTTSLIEVTDTGAGSSDTVLATAGANTAFRDVVLVPNVVPEPSTLALLGLGAAGWFFLRRRKF